MNTREGVGVGACCGQCVYIYTTNLYSRAIKTTEELIRVSCGSQQRRTVTVNIWRRVLVVPDLWVYRCLRPTLGRVCKCEWGRKRTTPSLSQSSQRERHPHISLHLTLQLVHSGVQPEQSSFHNDRQYSWWLSPSSWWEHEEELFVSKRFGRSDSFFQWCSAVEYVKKKMKAFVRFWFLFLSISFLMTMTMISLCRSPIFDGYGLFNEGFCILKTTNVSWYMVVVYHIVIVLRVSG